jgi:putative SOS response-associated peptidase YedK
MCGRYKRRGDKQRIAEAFKVRASLDELYLEESDDIPPGFVQPVVRLSDAGERVLEDVRWGFKLPDRLLFNTRSDNVLTSKFWKERFIEHSCIVPVSAFIEWQDVPKGQEKPKYETGVPGGDILGFAGLWSPRKNPKTNQWEDTFSVFTTDPNAKMMPIHDRQPVILEPRDYEEWLTPAERPPVHLLRVLPDEETELHLVNHVSVEPPCEAPAQGGLFG